MPSPLELKARPGIEARAIGARADRRSRDHLHRSDIGDGHHLVAAHAEQLLVLHVDGQAGRTFARSQRGAAGHGGFGGVDLHDFAGVFDIDVELARAIHGAVLGLLADRESGDDLIGLGVDGGGIVGPAIQGEDALGLGFVADRIGILAGLRLAGLLQRLQIEDGHAVGLPVGDEALADVAGHRDAVHAVQLGDLSHHLAGLRVHHFDDGAVRSIDAVRGRIDRDVVPAAGAADLDLVQDFVAFGAERGRGQQT